MKRVHICGQSDQGRRKMRWTWPFQSLTFELARLRVLQHCGPSERCLRTCVVLNVTGSNPNLTTKFLSVNFTLCVSNHSLIFYTVYEFQNSLIYWLTHHEILGTTERTAMRLDRRLSVRSNRYSLKIGFETFSVGFAILTP